LHTNFAFHEQIVFTNFARLSQAALQLTSTPTVNVGDIGVKKFLTPSPSATNLTAVKSQISNAVDGLRQKASK